MEAKPPFRFRKLRIAWAVFWGLTAVLLIALWVRSYWLRDSFTTITLDARDVGIISMLGKIMYGNFMFDIPGDGSIDFESSPVDEYNKPTPGFRWEHKPEMTLVEIPHWFLVLLSATLGVIPWIHWSNRFSLRTLLIATTLLAVVLGLAVWAVRK